MTDIVIDLETTANGGTDGTSPEAHYPNNRVLLYGHKVIGSGDVVTSSGIHNLIKDIHQNSNVVLIGHNFKFDLKYLMR